MAPQQMKRPTTEMVAKGMLAGELRTNRPCVASRERKPADVDGQFSNRIDGEFDMGFLQGSRVPRRFRQEPIKRFWTNKVAETCASH